MDIKIMVSTHKPYIMPRDTSIYLPIQVGYDEVEEHFGFQGDNTGDNISYKHRHYSDLSAVYWGWKNLNVDYLGSCHYRRYFVSKKPKYNDDRFFRYILNRNEIEKMLKICPVIIAKKRNYYIESIEAHFKHTHESGDFDLLREVIAEISPEYLDAFEKVAKSTSAHLFNTFIMRKDYVNSFCSFMFPVLFEVEKRVNFSNRSEFESRTCGYLGEFLLDTWIIKNAIEYQEVELRVLDGENKLRKALTMIRSKVLGEKYGKSF